MSAGVIGCSKWDLDTPALVLDLEAMQRNIERMATTFREAGVAWRPHTKAIKVPAIAHKLITAGAHGVTCAKVSEAEVMAAAGIRDILIANQLVGDQKIARAVNLLPHADLIVAVDNPTNVAQLSRAACIRGLPLRVVVEVNLGMNRAGVEPGEPVLSLSQLVSRSEGLRFAGLMGWEGHTVGLPDLEEKRRMVENSLKLLADSATLCREAGLSVGIVSCGGTGTYLISCRQPGVTEIQAGGGIFCDVYYHDVMQVDHEYALTILTTVTSRPTPTRIVCDSGKKAMSTDAAQPRPRIDGPVQSMAFSAEHTRIELSEARTEPRVGDKLEFVVGYSDTTTMLHDEVYATRDDKVEVLWPILGRGKLR